MDVEPPDEWKPDVPTTEYGDASTYAKVLEAGNHIRRWLDRDGLWNGATYFRSEMLWDDKWYDLDVESNVWVERREGSSVNEEPVDECDNCGADLYFGVVHDCPVTGSPVVVEPVTD